VDGTEVIGSSPQEFAASIKAEMASLARPRQYEWNE
jgi:hypothetical protein